MFTLDTNLTFNETVKTLEGENDAYKYRLLDGVDSAKVAGLKDFFEQLKYVISNCLLDGTTEKPVGDLIAYRFIRARYNDAVALVNAIMNHTNKLDAEDEKEVETAKNLSSATNGQSTALDTVVDSVSIQGSAS